MRTTEVLALLLPAAATASPLLNPKVLDALFCKANDIVIRVLDKDAAATAYCSNVLSVPTSTISTTATVTPASVYTTLFDTVYAATVTVTVAEENELEYVTQTTITTEMKTEYTTTTLTTSTATISCLNSAYTASAPTVEAVQPQKRTIGPLKKPDAIPNNWELQRISKACSCLSIPTPSTTTTLLTTLPTGTVTTHVTEVQTVTIPTVVTNIHTETDIVTSTSSATTTETITAYATATTIASNGVKYRAYTHTFNANVQNSGFTSPFFKSQSPNFSGILPSLTFSTPNWPNGNTQLKLSDRPTSFASDQSAILMQGFFIAQESGTYRVLTRSETIDNWGYLWVGDVAYSNWDDGNAAFKASRVASGPYISGETSLKMSKGDAVPWTYLWANGGGVGQNLVQIVSPSGKISTDHTGYFVQACEAGVFA